MRRFALLLFFLAAPAFAFREFPQPGARIGVLRMSPAFAHGADQTVAGAIQSDLRGELHKLGFDAFDARMTFDELSRGGASGADYWVEVVSGDAVNHPVGGGTVGAGAIGVDMAVVLARVAAEVRLYDKSLRLIDHYDLRRDTTAVLPTAIGIGGRSFFAWLPLPLIQYAQYRSAAHAVAEQAAARIAGR